MSRTLYIVDREGELARSLAVLLASRDLRVETRSDVEELLATLDHERAVCVLVGRDDPGVSADQIRKRLLLRGIALPVITVDAGGTTELTPEVLEAVDTEVVPTAPGREGARDVARGEQTDAPQRAGSAPMAGPDAFPSIEVLRERFRRLTSREREVAQLVAQGYSSKELARALSLSKSTVDNHRARILEKLQLANSVQVTRFLSTLLAEH